ncbi:MAG TPA: hypothetical protein VF143_06425 [Candidatus Nanopelagicales bacterium]
MTTPAPRPALKRAADAHIHPAAPAGASHLRPAPDPGEVTDAPLLPEPRPAAEPAGAVSRLSGPLGGTTSDALRAAGKRARRGGRGGRDEKRVELTVQVPKALRKEFRAALKAEQLDADEVVTTMLRVWLDR